MLTPINQIIILMELLLPPTMVLSKLNTKNKKHYTSAISRSKMKTLSNTIHLENQFTNLSPPDLFIILKVSLCYLYLVLFYLYSLVAIPYIPTYLWERKFLYYFSWKNVWLSTYLFFLNKQTVVKKISHPDFWIFFSSFKQVSIV